jgi:hypothetical protein
MEFNPQHAGHCQSRRVIFPCGGEGFTLLGGEGRGEISLKDFFAL